MKQSLFILFMMLFLYAEALNIRIIESTSANPGHTMDTQWQSVATAMGHTPTISPQTTLDNTTFFASSDVLIISSGVIALTATRISNIQAFASTGKPVYIQAEYLNTYTANGAFQSIVNALGGGFTWGGPRLVLSHQ